MKLIFVRHGQTDYNKNNTPQGQEIDVFMNETGISQIEEVARNLPNVDFIISSPLKRAAQTAQIINRKFKKDIKFNDDIKELRYGSLAGNTWSELEKITGDPDIREKDENITFDYSKYGGDTAGDLKQRVSKFVEDMKVQYPDKTILVTTHGGVVDTMHVLFPKVKKPSTTNATVHEFIF